jgi:hypothetical protein
VLRPYMKILAKKKGAAMSRARLVWIASGRVLAVASARLAEFAHVGDVFAEGGG